MDGAALVRTMLVRMMMRDSPRNQTVPVVAVVVMDDDLSWYVCGAGSCGSTTTMPLCLVVMVVVVVPTQSRSDLERPNTTIPDAVVKRPRPSRVDDDSKWPRVVVVVVMLMFVVP